MHFCGIAYRRISNQRYPYHSLKDSFGSGQGRIVNAQYVSWLYDRVNGIFHGYFTLILWCMQYSCFIAVHKTRLSMFYAFNFRLMKTMVYFSLLLVRWGRGVVVAVALSSPVALGFSLSQPTVPPVTAGSAPWWFPGFSVFIVYYMYIYLISRWLALITNKSYCFLFLVSTLNKDFLSYLILSYSNHLFFYLWMTPLLQIESKRFPKLWYRNKWPRIYTF